MNFSGDLNDMYKLDMVFLKNISLAPGVNNAAQMPFEQYSIFNTGYQSPSEGLQGLFSSLNAFDQQAAINPYNLDFTHNQYAQQYNQMPGIQANQNQMMNQFMPMMMFCMGIMQLMMQMVSQFMGGMMGNQAMNNPLMANTLLDNQQNFPFTNANTAPYTGNATEATPAGYNQQTAPYAPVNSNYTGPVPQGNAGMQAAQIALHESTLGINEADGSYRKYGQPSHWCGAFAEWCVKQATGGKVPWAGENFHYVPNITNWAQKNGVYESYNAATAPQSIKPGDMVIFRINGKESAHVGIVTRVNPDGSIETVEGNTSDQCKKRTYAANDPRLQGFLKINQLEAEGRI
jgi:hypothetical protein